MNSDWSKPSISNLLQPAQNAHKGQECFCFNMNETSSENEKGNKLSMLLL